MATPNTATSGVIPSLPPKVLPGQLISAEFMNAILDELSRLRSGSGATGGTVSVPSFFGLALSQARALISQPTSQVSLGAVIDVSGSGIDILSSANSGLIVLNQVPAAGVLVVPATPVSLVVSRSTSTSGGGSTIPNPTLVRFETLAGAVSTAFRVGDSMVLVGTNFSAVAAQNVVSIGGVAATVVSDPGDPTRRLIAIVPTGIAGAPTTPAGAPLTNIPVAISVSGAAPLSMTITLNGPAGTPQPQITTFTATVAVGSTLVITGSNFGPDAATNSVFLSGTPAGGGTATTNGVQATIVSAKPTEIDVTVPDFGDLPAAHLSTKLSQIRLQVLDAAGAVTGATVSSTSVTIIRP